MKTIPALFTFAALARAMWAEPSADQAKLVAANTGFGLALLNQITQPNPDANVFISPFSVSSVLQLVENGAAGQTKTEMQQALGTSGMAAGSLNAAFKDLNQQLTGRQDVVLNLANGLWFQQGFHLKPAFVADNQKFFLAKLASVNFEKPEAAQTINDWSDKQTKGKIKEVVQFPFPPLTRLILANSIYFKGKWVKSFEKNLTKPREFHLANRQTKQTPMMFQSGHFSYQETEDFQAVKLPYQGDLQMELYLPKTNSTPQKLLAVFAREDWQKDLQAGFGQHEGDVMLPKFKIEYAIVLNDPLQALGMKTAFDKEADFSGVADEPLYISQVKQNSFVDVNEEGTEAAAVTTVTMLARGIAMPLADRFTMILDHPFFFVISDVRTGSILFLGIVNDPNSGDY